MYVQKHPFVSEKLDGPPNANSGDEANDCGALFEEALSGFGVFREDINLVVDEVRGVVLASISNSCGGARKVRASRETTCLRPRAKPRDPNDAKLELGCGVLEGLGGAPARSRLSSGDSHADPDEPPEEFRRLCCRSTIMVIGKTKDPSGTDRSHR